MAFIRATFFGLLSAFSCLHFVNAHNILVYDAQIGQSHSNFVGRLADILVEEGHNVTLLAAEIVDHLKVATKKAKIVKVSQDPLAKMYRDKLMSSEDMSVFTLRGVFLFPFVAEPNFSGMFAAQCEKTLTTPGLIESLKDQKFDLIINENFDYCGTGLSHVLGIRALITVSSTLMFETVAKDAGIPIPTASQPGFWMHSFDGHSLIDRAVNYIFVSINEWFHRQPQISCQKVFNKLYGDDFPSLKELTANSAFFFINSIPYIDYAGPTLDKVINIGGISTSESSPLSKEWSDILNLRKRTLLLSFGSLANSTMMPEELKLAVLEALSSLRDTTVIWKYENLSDEFATNHLSKVDNVIPTAWMPQADLLADARLTAFVSHAGAGSVFEAAHRGVPALFIPLFAEQPRNAGMMVKNGIGKTMDKFELAHPKKFAAILTDLMEDEELRKRTKKAAAFLAHAPFSPRELFVRHVDFAARFGPIAALTPASAFQSFIERNNVDLVFIVIASVFVVLVVIVSLVRKCVRRTKVKAE